MTAIGHWHLVCVNRANSLFIQAFRNRAVVKDVLFVVEVADSSLSYDRNIKLPRFAVAGIPEVWLEDSQHDHPADSVSPLAFPDPTFRVVELLRTD
jgi:Uma2 family endonuclease